MFGRSLSLVHIGCISTIYYMIGGVAMIPINKSEAEEVRKRIPSAHVRRTARHKSGRHKYFVEETYKVLALLYKLRKRDPVVERTISD